MSSFSPETTESSCCGEESNLQLVSAATSLRISEGEDLTEHFKLRGAYEPISARNVSQVIFTSGAANLHIPKFIGRKKYEFTFEAESYLRRQKKSVQLKERISLIADRASEFLGKERIHSDIEVSLFADPEYDKWVEPKIRIRVPEKEVGRAYHVYDKLICYSLQGVPRKTAKRVFVTIETK